MSIYGLASGRNSPPGRHRLTRSPSAVANHRRVGSAAPNVGRFEPDRGAVLILAALAMAMKVQAIEGIARVALVGVGAKGIWKTRRCSGNGCNML